MGESTENSKKFGKKQIIIIIAIALLLIAGLIAFFLFRGKIRATTMRILRLEGTVSMEENGKPKSVKENLRLKSGNALDTEIQSLVSIGLDDTKIVTMNEASRAEFSQKGRYLDLNLTKGSLFFEVSKALEDDETFEIRTSTMVVGIRGTSGYVSVENGIEELIITDGHVHVVGTNPVTKEVKEVDVKAGQRARVYLYNDRSVDSIMFEIEDITEHELPEFVLRMLRENLTLLDKVVKETGWDKNWILGITDDSEGSGEATDDGAGSAVTENNTSETSDDSGENKEVNSETEEDTNTETEEDNTNNNNNTQENQQPEQTELQKEMEAARNSIAQTNTDGSYTLTDGTLFDASYYGTKYPDVVATYGTDPVALLGHYVTYGKAEGRIASQAEEDAIAAAWNAAHPSSNNTNTTTTTTNTNANTNTTNVVQANGSVTLSDGSQGTYANGVLTITSAGSGNTATLPATITDQNGNSVNLSLANVDVDASSGVTSLNASAVNPSNSDMISYVNTSNSVTEVNNSTTTIRKTVGAGITASVTPSNAGITSLNDLLTNIATPGSVLNNISFGNSVSSITYSTATRAYDITTTANGPCGQLSISSVAADRISFTGGTPITIYANDTTTSP